MLRLLKRIYWVLQAQFGIDPLKMMRFFLGISRYIADFYRFRLIYRGQMEIVPCLHDWGEEGGATKNEYFWQDLVVARKIYEKEPEIHVDIGSRVDGFVAHVASFRDLEVIDVRPITASIPGVTFRQADLMQSVASLDSYCDSLSCLHALEHFGLGRYGDPLSVQGFRLGFISMARMVKEGGTFYLSVPVGQERVEFNANWIFDPRSILSVATDAGLSVTELIVINQEGGMAFDFSNDLEMEKLAQRRYSLGLFTFIKEKRLVNK